MHAGEWHVGLETKVAPKSQITTIKQEIFFSYAVQNSVPADKERQTSSTPGHFVLLVIQAVKVIKRYNIPHRFR